MKVSASSALHLVLLLVASSYESPLFGTGGMMKRKFPGATDMSYQTYREIANSNAASAASGAAARTGGAGVISRTGGSSSGDSAWMFENGLAAPSPVIPSNQPASLTKSGLFLNQQQSSYNPQQASFNQQRASFSQQSPSSNHQQTSINQQQPSIKQQLESYNQQGLPFYPQNFQDTYQGRYPSVWDPRESYASLQFPYHAPAPLDYDEMFILQNKIYNDYY